MRPKPVPRERALSVRFRDRVASGHLRSLLSFSSAHGRPAAVTALACLAALWLPFLPPSIQDPASLRAALSDHLAHKAGQPAEPLADGGAEDGFAFQKQGILAQGTRFITDTSATNQVGCCCCYHCRCVGVDVLWLLVRVLLVGGAGIRPAEALAGT